MLGSSLPPGNALHLAFSVFVRLSLKGG